jgi:hypothetical protein
MSANIVGLQQIIITLVFLGVLVGVLIFLKRKGSFIRANLHGDKRIMMVEETAISPTEKLRLLKIDGQMFVMASAKGVQPVLSPLYSASSKTPSNASSGVSAQDSSADFAAQFSANAGMASQLEEPDNAQSLPPLELTRPVSAPAKQAAKVNEADVKAFQEKFKSWRQR